MKTTLPRLSAAIILFLLSGLCAMTGLGLVHAPRAALSTEERIAYQKRIEEVYWRHRTATQKEGERIAFNLAMPDAAIREKVEDTLRKSAALAKYWQRPVTSAQLQAEVARMATQTRQPDVLHELWSALDNDPAVIAEVLARPLLVERQLQSWYASDTRFHGALRQQIETELQANAGKAMDTFSGNYAQRRLVKNASGADLNKSQVGGEVRDKNAALSDRDWQRLVSDLANALPVAREATSAGKLTAESLPVGLMSKVQENEHEFFVVTVLSAKADELQVASVTWPKRSADQWYQSVRNELPAVAATDAATFPGYELPQIAATSASPADDKWLPVASALSEREFHTAVWTGSEMIVWGGFYGISNYTNYLSTVAGRYNPATDSWSLSTVTNAPGWRQLHTAIWTGTEMIVWGGYGGDTGTTNTGGRYNPATNVWTATSLTNAPAGRQRHSAVWTGSKMIVWGGRTGDTDDTTTNTGGIYDPVANSWTALTTSNAPSARLGFSAVWSGKEMIIWGGYNFATNSVFNNGGRYNPQSNSWQATTTSGAPSARFAHNAVWTGSRMLLWAGGNSITANVRYNDGALYDPTSNSWSPITTANAPSPRYGSTAVWTGTEMIVWGGDNGVRILGGGRYNPETNTWQSIPLTNGPESSVAHTAIWTGNEMIVWGGQESTRAADINTGARYNPQSNSWVPVTNPQNGGARNEHPAVWTGAEMIIWGSYTNHSTPTNTGGRYYPATDTWLPTSMINVPHQRYAPLGVWSGSEFVVWGGCQDPFCFTRFNTGGRYNPSTDTWRETSTVNAAEPRYWFSAVWTGSEMLVWGGCDAQTCGPGGNSDRNGLNNGGRYNPQTDTWQPMSLAGAPTGRWFHAAAWSGNEMIVWGGEDGNVGPHNDGARYNPTSDTWTPTSLTNAPIARNHATGIWAGNRMMVWGGDNSLLDADLNNGGLYNPATDTWTATTQTNAPSARVGHSLVWTGSEVIVFGGCSGVNCQTDTNTGSRYNPNTNTWRATSTFEAPSARDVHSAVFTGSEMIVFGGESCARCEPILDTGGRYGVAAPAVATGAVSRKTHGSAGTFDAALPISGTAGIESRSGGATGDHQIVVTFNTAVSVNGSPQAQVTSGNGQVANNGAVTVTGNTVTIPLTHVTDAQTLTITLSAVDNGNGPVNVTVPVSFLLGDTNGNGVVNATDVGLTKSQIGSAVGASNFRNDVNLSGTVNATDVGQVKANIGHGMP